MNTKLKTKLNLLRWIETTQKSVGGAHNINKIEELGKTLDGMNQKQLRVITQLMCASFTHGCDSTRGHIKTLKRNDDAYDSTHNQPILKSIGHLHLLPGGVA